MFYLGDASYIAHVAELPFQGTIKSCIVKISWATPLIVKWFSVGLHDSIL